MPQRSHEGGSPLSAEGRRPYHLRHIPVTAVDLADTARVVNEAFHRYEIMPSDRTSPGDLQDEAGREGEFLQLVDADGILQATAMVRGASVEEDGHDFHDVERAFYFGLAGVADGATRTGLGAALVRECERLARARGYSSVVLGTLREFDLPAYYERQGYITVGTQEFPAGHWGVVVPHQYHEMQKRLAPTFRVATPADAQRVTEIINAAYRAEDFFIDGNRTDEIEVADLIAADEIMVLDPGDGTLAGSVYLRADGHRGYFGMLSVDPVRQKRGWGRLIVDMAEQRAIDFGRDKMDLTVVNLREELPPWYRRLGYVANGTLPFPDPWKLKRAAHMVMMTKPLTNGREGREIWL